MATTIRYTVYPKTIDASDNEVEFEDYLVENTFTTKTEYTFALAYTNGTDESAIPTLANGVVCEIISDAPVTLKIYQSNGSTSVATITTVKYFVLSQSEHGTTTGGNYVYKLIKPSAGTANITCRQFNNE